MRGTLTGLHVHSTRLKLTNFGFRSSPVAAAANKVKCEAREAQTKNCFLCGDPAHYRGTDSKGRERGACRFHRKDLRP